MFVRSSKYHDLRVQLQKTEFELETAKHCMREARVARDRAQRELEEGRDDYLHRLLLRRVSVHLKDLLISIEGSIVSVYEDSIVLSDARTHLDAAGNIETLEGNQVIARSQIGWVSELLPGR